MWMCYICVVVGVCVRGWGISFVYAGYLMYVLMLCCVCVGVGVCVIRCL